jgi:hypothetical protein
MCPGSLAAGSAVLTMAGNQRAIEDAKKRCNSIVHGQRSG